MAPSDITIRRLRPGILCPALVCCAVAVGLLSSSGCASVNKVFNKPEPQKQADPLLGEVHPQNTQPYGPTPPAKKDAPADPASQKSSAVDPLIGPSPTSPAYLASVTKPLPGAQTLAINDGKPAPFQLANNAQPLQPTVQPVPKDPAFTNSSWVPAPTSSTSSFSGGTFSAPASNFVDPTFAPLTSRGITQHRVDPQPDGSTRLIAIAPQPGGTFRTYDVTARDVPSAVQAVVQQIDRP